MDPNQFFNDSIRKMSRSRSHQRHVTPTSIRRLRHGNKMMFRKINHKLRGVPKKCSVSQCRFPHIRECFQLNFEKFKNHKSTYFFFQIFWKKLKNVPTMGKTHLFWNLKKYRKKKLLFQKKLDQKFWFFSWKMCCFLLQYFGKFTNIHFTHTWDSF